MSQKLKPFSLDEFRSLIGDLQVDDLNTSLLEVVANNVPPENAKDVGPLLGEFAAASRAANEAGMRMFSPGPASDVLLTVAVGFEDTASARKAKAPWQQTGEFDNGDKPQPVYNQAHGVETAIALLDELGVELPADTNAADFGSFLEKMLAALKTARVKETLTHAEEEAMEPEVVESQQAQQFSAGDEPVMVESVYSADELSPAQVKKLNDELLQSGGMFPNHETPKKGNQKQ